MTLGYELYNPFNIKQTSIDWHGEIKPSSNHVFCQFQSDILGLRAGFLLIKNQINEGYNTITKLITHYAPPTENNTSAYIKAVSNQTGIAPDTELSLTDVMKLGQAIICHEQSMCKYEDSVLKQAALSAGLPIGS